MTILHASTSTLGYTHYIYLYVSLKYQGRLRPCIFAMDLKISFISIFVRNILHENFMCSPQSFFCCKCARGNNEEDVEDGRADDGSDSDVTLGDEHADDGGEELWGGPAGRHERRASHVGADSKLEKNRKKKDKQN